MIPSEHREQCAVVDWLDNYAALRWPGLAIVNGRLPYFAVPNGGLRNKIVAAKLKAEGVRAGVPDLIIMVPRMGFHALCIEMKRREGGVVSPAQDAWFEGLRTMGYDATICEGAAEAIETITDYLNGGE